MAVLHQIVTRQLSSHRCKGKQISALDTYECSTTLKYCHLPPAILKGLVNLKNKPTIPRVT